MGRRLERQTAWISGAASGIGAATARLFAGEGANVALVDINADRGAIARGMAAEHGGPAVFIQADVSVEEQVRDSLAQTVARFGGLQIIVNCAGLVHVKLLHEYDLADWDRLMGVNLKSIFFSVKHGLQYLQRHPRSYVVNVASISSFVGQAATPAYTASKSAVLGLTRSIALDYAGAGPPLQLRLPGNHRYADVARAPGQDPGPRGGAPRTSPPRSSAGATLARGHCEGGALSEL